MQSISSEPGVLDVSSDLCALCAILLPPVTGLLALMSRDSVRTFSYVALSSVYWLLTMLSTNDRDMRRNAAFASFEAVNACRVWEKDELDVRDKTP